MFISLYVVFIFLHLLSSKLKAQRKEPDHYVAPNNPSSSSLPSNTHALTFFSHFTMDIYGHLLKHSDNSTRLRIRFNIGRARSCQGLRITVWAINRKSVLHDYRPRALIGCLQEFLLWQTNWPTTPWCVINTGKCHWADNQPAL